MFTPNPFLRIESPRPSNERLRSAILNCICPECGGGLSLAADQLRCQGWCGTDWWPVWIRIRKTDRSQSSHRLMPAPQKCAVTRVSIGARP
jgi:hypothetical protein